MVGEVILPNSSMSIPYHVLCSLYSWLLYEPLDTRDDRCLECFLGDTLMAFCQKVGFLLVS